MLTVYNRNKEAVGILQTSGQWQEVSDVTVTRRLNSDYSLSFLLPMNSVKYPLLEKEGLIQCEGQFYIYKQSERKREGMGRVVQFSCPHIMRRLMDIHMPYSSAVDEALGADISTMLNIISDATGGVFTFTVMDAIDPQDVYKFGYSNCLKAFQDLVKLYDVEFVPDNYNIKIYKRISIDNGAQYRFGKNIISNSFQDNTHTLCTRMTGLAKDSLTIIDLPSSHLTADEIARLAAIPGSIVDGVVKVPYLISQYASTWSTPDNTYFDSDFEDNDIDASTEAGKVQLLEEIRKKLAASEIPDIQITIDAADTWKINQGDRPTIGQTVYLIDADMEMNQITARVMELTEYPFDPSKNASVTLANYLLKDYNDIMNDLSTTKDTLSSFMTNKNVNTSYFEAATRQAIQDINNSKTELIYPPEGGILAQDKTNALKQVRLTSAGLGISTDGWSTVKSAVTADGVAAELVVGILGQFAQVKTDSLIVGSAPIGDSLIGSATVWNTASNNAIAAQQAAANAQTSADAANAELSDIASDGKLTPVEKQATEKEWNIIVSEKPTIDAQASTYGITTELTSYDNAYNALSAYITPLLSDLTTTSDIVGTDFRSEFKTYYDARTALLKKISDTAKSLADSAQTTADNALPSTSPKLTKIDDTGIYSGQVKTDQLIAGAAKITSALIDTIKASQIDVSTGKIVAAQIDAANLHVSSANIDGLLTAAQIDATNLHVNVANIDGSLVVGTNVGLGTAQDASGVTSIINNTVTTGYVNALGVTAQSVQAGWVYAGTVNANQINGGTISGVTINVTTDLTVGNNIYIGDQAATLTSKKIAFNGAANISTISDGFAQHGIGISASRIELSGGPIIMQNETIDFSGSTINGLQAPIYFVN